MLVFDHVGLTTTEPQPDENWIEQSRCWVTNPRKHAGAYRIPALCEGHDRAGGGASQSATSHFASKSLEPHIEGQEILIPPFVVADFVRVVFIRKHGMIFEYMQYLNDSWFGA